MVARTRQGHCGIRPKLILRGFQPCLTPCGMGYRVFAMAMMLALLASCGKESQDTRFQIVAFGSVTEIRLPDSAPETALRVESEAQSLLQMLHHQWHPWEPGSLQHLNEALQQGQGLEVPTDLAQLIEHSIALHELSQGWFDPSAAALIRVWGFHDPDSAEWRTREEDLRGGQWRPPGMASLRIDGLRVSSTAAGLSLDLNAVAEGMATVKLLDILAALDVDDALISMGGDVYALGHRHGQAWRIAVRDPRGGIVGVIRAADGMAVYTSGTYARYIDDDALGQRHGHIVDPKRGRPARGPVSVTVVHPDPLLADAAATALVASGEAHWESVARAMDLRCLMVIQDDGSIHLSQALAPHMAAVPTEAKLLDLGAADRRCADTPEQD